MKKKYFEPEFELVKLSLVNEIMKNSDGDEGGVGDAGGEGDDLFGDDDF